MPSTNLTRSAQDYLKVIWVMREWDETPVTSKALAQRFGVAPSSTSESVKRLTDAGLVRHAPYGSIELTPEGETMALTMVRRHRLIETYLVEQLDYAWDEAHDDAEILEHAASDRFVAALDEALDHPDRDPHGDPIPSADGVVSQPKAVRLADLPEGSGGRVARISDADPRMLRYFASIGLVLDAVVEVVERRDFAGVLTLMLPDGTTADLGNLATAAIWVARA